MKQKNEILAYLIFGALTTLVSILSFYAFNTGLGIHYLVANILSWVLAVIFAYITNKIFVFQAKNEDIHGLWREIQLFLGARVLSLLVEEAGMWIFVGTMAWEENLSKVIMQIVVVILNYVLSKWIIFRKKKS